MKRKYRAGFSFVELTVAMALIAILLTTSVQVVRTVTDQFRRNEERLAAIEAAGNMMELLTALPDEALGPNALQRPELAEVAEETLRRWNVELLVTPPAGEPAGQRIELQLSRRSSAGRRPAEPPVRLTAWKYNAEVPADET